LLRFISLFLMRKKCFFSCVSCVYFIGLFDYLRLIVQKESQSHVSYHFIKSSGNDSLFLVFPHPKLIVNTEYICHL